MCVCVCVCVCVYVCVCVHVRARLTTCNHQETAMRHDYCTGRQGSLGTVPAPKDSKGRNSTFTETAPFNRGKSTTHTQTGNPVPVYF